MNANAQRLCCWAGPVAVILFFIAFWPCMGFVPAPSPSLGEAQVAQMFKANGPGICIGSLLITISCPLLLVYYCAISVQLKRVEGSSSPYTYVQMICGAISAMPFIPAALAWCTAAYRPDRSPDIIYMLNDFAWLMLFMVSAPFMLQFAAIGLAVLGDKRDAPIFPRWFGYFSLAGAATGVGGWFVMLVTNGPFAWNGVFGNSIPSVVFGLSTVVQTAMVLRAISSEERETLQNAASPSARAASL